MLERLSLVTLMAAVQKCIEDGTGLRCYDIPPENALSPLYYIELVRVTPRNTKRLYIDEFTIWLHSIAEEPQTGGAISSVGVLDMIQAAQEALTTKLELPERFNLVMQEYGGLMTLKTDPTGERHGVEEYRFRISYGMRTKN